MSAKQKKTSKSKGKGNPIKNLKASFKSYKIRFTVGLLTVGLSLYLSLAFISFLHSGYADRSKFDLPLSDLFRSATVQVDNIAGKFGAWAADLLINQWFGLASSSIIFLLFLIGLRLLGTKILSLKRTLFHSAIITIWLSLTMGFLFLHSVDDHYLLLDGAHGYHLSTWLQATIGWVGTLILIILSLLTYMALTFDWFIPFLKKNTHINLSKSGKQEEDPTTTSPQNPQTDSPQEQEQALKPEPNPEFDHTISIPSQPAAAPPQPEQPETPTIVQLDPQHNLHNQDSVEPDHGFQIEQAAAEETLNSAGQQPLGDYDPTLDLSAYKMPTFDLLEEHQSSQGRVTEQELIQFKNKIVKTLEDYKIQIKSIKATVGPTVTLYEIVPMPGIRISKIKSLEDDIALSLSALGIRIIAPIPGKGTIGIEVPNAKPSTVSMKSLILSPKFQNAEMELPVALGKTISNETFVFDLAKMPHLLMAGATGQGKSVGLNAVLASLLYKKHPAEVKFVLVDPKKVELTLFNKIERHFLAKLPDTEDAIITDNTKVINTLNSLCIEMDNRYSLLKDAMVRNIKEYNEKFKQRKLNPENGHRFLPYIVLVVDEFADLIMTAGKEVETPIARLAQLARAIGIHLIIATQRPSVNVITGIIKANFPARIAFRVSSKIDSRTILDGPGADQLIGRGDLLFTQGNDIVRVQCGFVDTPEVEKITEFIGSQKGYGDAYLLPEYVGEESGTSLDVDISERDVMFREAAEIIVTAQQGSASLLQRKLKLGYNRAGRLIDQLEAAGIVGPFEGSKARSVNIPDLISLEQFLNNEN